MKKYLALILSAALLLALIAGCTGGEAPPAADPGEPIGDGAGGETPSEPAAPVDGVVLEFWDMMWGNDVEYTQASKDLTQRFNEENGDGITVNVQLIPWDGYYQTFVTAVTSGAAPDIATAATPQPIQYAVMGESLELDPILEQWEAENNPIIDDIGRDNIEFYRYNGKLYGITFALDPRGLTYRKDIFEDAGITDLPTTWDEFADCLRKVKETYPDMIPFVTATADQMSVHTIVQFLVQNDTNVVDENLVPQLSSPQGIETLEFFKMLYDEELVSRGTAGYASADAEKIFVSGEAAVLFRGPPSILAGTELFDKCGILPALKGPSGSQPRSFAWHNGIQGFSQTQSPDGTRAFIKWWCENNESRFIDGLTGHMPIRDSYFSDPYYSEDWVRAESIENMVKDSVSVVWPVPNLYPQFSQIEGEQIPGQALLAILTGEEDIQAIAERTDAALQEALDTYADE